jgi:hypothetical protein
VDFIICLFGSIAFLFLLARLKRKAPVAGSGMTVTGAKLDSQSESTWERALGTLRIEVLSGLIFLQTGDRLGCLSSDRDGPDNTLLPAKSSSQRKIPNNPDIGLENSPDTIGRLISDRARADRRPTKTFERRTHLYVSHKQGRAGSRAVARKAHVFGKARARWDRRLTGTQPRCLHGRS